MASYTDDEGNKHTYPASMVWKVGVPAVIVIGVIVLWVLL